MSDSCHRILQPIQFHARSFSHSYGKQNADYRILNPYNPHILCPAHKTQQLYSIYFSISTSTSTTTVHLYHAELCYIKSAPAREQMPSLCTQLAPTSTVRTAFHSFREQSSSSCRDTLSHSNALLFVEVFFLSKGNEARA